ncbi:MAG: hypothetical protein JJD97_04005 [Gemmatimonadaceae bacterium]|nr:hypothetical protein [Gemmatimonadaceae bacterium]
MAAPRILIVYGTHHGQSAAVARRIAESLQTAGGQTLVVNGGKVPRGLTPRDFDAVIVGGSIQYNRHQRFLRDFVRAHRDALNAMPSAFFSVSGAAAGRTIADHTKADGYVADFLRETGWHPTDSATFGGAMAYTSYNPLMRWMMRRISARVGGPTDTTRDHSFTDWAQVERFANAFASTVSQPPRERFPVTA